MKMRLFKPTCNLNTVQDARGGVFSFVPDKPISEWTFQYINRSKTRGNHCHPEFDEYVMMVSGEGVEIEKDLKTGEEQFVHLSTGTCVYIPANTYHVFIGITDCKLVSFLSKPWKRCKTPIVHENLGHGKGEFGDPGSDFHGRQHQVHSHA